VVSLWSDGDLVAIDAPTGDIAWRAETPGTSDGYAGGRSGAGVLYHVEELLTAVTPDGHRVVVRTIIGQAWGFDADNGNRLWHKEGPMPDCGPPGFTTTSGHYVLIDLCANRGVAELYDVTSGALVRTWTPGGPDPRLYWSGCRMRRSECRVLISLVGEELRGWTFDADAVETAIDLVGPGLPLITGNVAVTQMDTEFVGRDLCTGRELWRWTAPPGGATFIRGQPNWFHAVTMDLDLITIDPETGRTRSTVSLLVDGDDVSRSIEALYASDGFVVLERADADPAVDDNHHFFGERPVLLAVT